MNTVIKQLRGKLAQFEKEYERKSEDDLSNQIILWLLEDCLGYERNSMHWEKRMSSKNRNRFADIVIDIREGEKLIVETKRYNPKNDLDNDDIQQLIDYLSREKSSWGILTNGREILLINIAASAGINVAEKLVLRINIAVGNHRGKNEKYIKYLSKEKIFDSSVTNYYRDVAYFFSLHKLSKSSRERYENTRATTIFVLEENDSDIAEKILSLEEMKLILDRLETQNKPSKIMFFILCAYYGFDRALIVKFFSLPWACVDYEHCCFELEGKKYPMVKRLAKCLKEKQHEYKEKGIKPTAIHVIRNGEKYFPAKKDTINALFDEDIKTVNKDNERMSTLTPQKMRAVVIYNLCKCGCILDEVSYLTNATVSQILRYVPEDIIEKNGMRVWRSGKRGGYNYHPYKEVFDT